jgi:NADH dehydrogenase
MPGRDIHHVVVVGGGFGGLRATQCLEDAPVRVTLVDRRNFHLFQPLLYQVATGGLSPANIAAPLRAILRRQRNAQVLLGEVLDIDLDARRVVLRVGELAYNTLVVATGVSHSYFGRPEWEAHAPGLKTVEDATEIRRRILLAFEAAERTADAAEVRECLTFVVVGGGPTGVELAGTLGEMALYTLRREFRRVDPQLARIVLVEGAGRILQAFPPELSAEAVHALRRLGVEVRTGTMVTDMQPEGVTLRCGGVEERIAARTVLWAAGVAASPLAAVLARRGGGPVNGAGRIRVERDLTLPGRPDVFVIGDVAHAADDAGKPLPGVAPVALQQGRYVARVIAARLAGAPAPPPFRYRDLGSLATIGRKAAVGVVLGRRLTGLVAWLAWLFIHLIQLVVFESRVLVLVQWAWNYVTYSRSARLITGEKW